MPVSVLLHRGDRSLSPASPGHAAPAIHVFHTSGIQSLYPRPTALPSTHTPHTGEAFVIGPHRPTLNLATWAELYHGASTGIPHLPYKKNHPGSDTRAEQSPIDQSGKAHRHPILG